MLTHTHTRTLAFFDLLVKMQIPHQTHAGTHREAEQRVWMQEREMRGKNRRHTRSSRENPSSVHAQSASCPLFLLLLSPLHQISPAVRLPSLAISYSEAAGHAGPDVCCLAPRALLSGCAGEMFRTEESGCKRLCVCGGECFTRLFECQHLHPLILCHCFSWSVTLLASCYMIPAFVCPLIPCASFSPSLVRLLIPRLHQTRTA